MTFGEFFKELIDQRFSQGAELDFMIEATAGKIVKDLKGALGAAAYFNGFEGTHFRVRLRYGGGIFEVITIYADESAQPNTEAIACDIILNHDRENDIYSVKRTEIWTVNRHN